MQKFYRDRSEGNAVEDLWAESMRYVGLRVDDNPAPEWDLAGRSSHDKVLWLPDGRQLKVEIKYDKLAPVTGNYFLELPTFDPETGHTKADLVVLARIQFTQFTIDQVHQVLLPMGYDRMGGDGKRIPGRTVSCWMADRHGVPLEEFRRTIVPRQPALGKMLMRRPQ